MTTYLITLHNPVDGQQPAPDRLAAIMTDVEQVNSGIRAAGGWVFAGGLAGTEDAVRLTADPGGSVVEGPYAESAEHLGGLTIVRSNDRAQVDGWARLLATATGLTIQVRPFLDQPE